MEKATLLKNWWCFKIGSKESEIINKHLFSGAALSWLGMKKPLFI
jgi:hypothetical protein